MGNAHYDYNHTLAIDPVNNPVVAHTDTPVISLALKFLHAWRKRIFSKILNFVGNALLNLAVQRPQIPPRRSRVLNCV